MQGGRNFFHIISFVIVTMLIRCCMVGQLDTNLKPQAKCVLQQNLQQDENCIPELGEARDYTDPFSLQPEGVTSDGEGATEQEDQAKYNTTGIREFITKASSYIMEATVEVFAQATWANRLDTLNIATPPSASESHVSSSSDEQGVTELMSSEFPDLTHDDEYSLAEEGSSVWCRGSDHTERLCRFRNLCYFPEKEDFVFFHGPHTIIEGVPVDRFSPTLLDASSVRDHNMQYFNYIDLDASSARGMQAHFVTFPSLIFRRFNPDNIMHVIHDDLLPMWATLRMVTGDSQLKSNSTHAQLYEPFDVNLLFMEGWSPGDYVELYQMFSKHELSFKKHLTERTHPTCYRDVHVGVLKSTTWYQYGFRQPQGPIPGHTVDANEVRQFTQYVSANLGSMSHEIQEQRDAHIVLLTRKLNRLILNEVELCLALMKEFNMKVLSIGAETHTVAEMVHSVSKASILVGMHGSLLALTMFLPQGSVVVELFPYAVNPNNYTPYKTLANLKGMDLSYRAWRNHEISRSVSHPGRTWDTGGIEHLEPALRDLIEQSNEVPRHLCCRDPAWLYRIYQDTIVDSSAVIRLVRDARNDTTTKRISQQINNNITDNPQHEYLENALQNNITPKTSKRFKPMYPAPVQNLQCMNRSDPVLAQIDVDLPLAPGLGVVWSEPWNVPLLGEHRIKYEVWIQEKGRQDYAAWILGKTGYYFSTGLWPETTYNIWVRCIIDDLYNGPFNSEHFSCTT